MKPTARIIAGAAVLSLVGAILFAQEMVATPDPVGGASPALSAAGNVNTGQAPTAEDWRYRWYEGRWWYWTPQDRWMWYSDDGRWIEFNAESNPPATAQSDNGLPTYDGPYTYYPAPRYWNGYYYPGVGVGVGPYGNVNVGVGRRIGVDVWGPHGGVRVGRIYVGW